MSRWVVALGVLLAPWGVCADTPSDPLALLGRMAAGGQRLNYSGTFTYQSGNRSETSRIVHFREGAGEFERLETLDGSPREVIRNNGEVRCVLPAQKTVIIDQAGSRRAFPSRLAEAWMNLAESYRIRRGETIEQFAFNEVKIGGDLDRSQLKSRFSVDQGAGWQIVNARGSELRPGYSGWTIKAAVPGFYQTSAGRRQMGAHGGETMQFVFSDGLAAVSVFIEPVDTAAESKLTPGPFESGPINLYKRVVGKSLVTALGEVPPRTVQRLAEAVEPARR